MKRAFTLIELLVVMAIISILVALVVPAFKMIGKSNDESQSRALVKAMIASARTTAMSQHRMAGVVFFQETAPYSTPTHGDQTAMQVVVEMYDQAAFQAGFGANKLHDSITGEQGLAFVSRDNTRQYLPAGVSVAALSDVAGSNVNGSTRVILFDANGNLAMQHGLVTIPPDVVPPAGLNPIFYGHNGDWMFYNTPGVKFLDAHSSPGFFLYSKSEFNAAIAQGITPETFIKQHADVVVVNSNTGNLLQ